MPVLTSKTLWQERNRLSEEQHKLAADGKTDEALVIEGQIKQLDLTLEHVIDEEANLRTAPKAPVENESFGERILGPRDEFQGLPIGFKNAADPTVVTVGAPTEIELTLDPKRRTVFGSFGSTLQEVAAVGSVSYKQRSTQTGMPGTWAGVVDGTSAVKEQVLYSYKDAVANKETIAGYVPISKDTLWDYDELLSIIENDLLIDLDDVTDEKYWGGNNNTGIIGIKNTTGIQTFSEAMGGMYFDAIRMMRTKVMRNARRIPTHVCISPEIKQAIDLYKTETGLYQSLGDNVYWGMQVVEDMNADGILVYDSFAATRRAIHGGVEVTVDYVNNQLIKNELTILAEHTKALQVRYPDAFCYASQTALDKTETTTVTPPSQG